MNETLINKVVWWIPFKNIRNLIRNLLLIVIQINNKVTSLDGKVTGLDGKVTGLDGKVTNLDGKVTGLDGKVTGLDGKVTGLDGKVTNLDGKVISLDNKISYEKTYDKANLLNNDIYEYDFIFSVGNNCYTANILETLKIKKYSSPFDWLYGVTIYDNLDIIINKFNRFIDYDDLILSSQKPNSFTYKNKYNKLFFMHDFKSNKIDNAEYLLVKEKYERRINRTLNYLTNNKVLMVHIVRAKTFINLNDILNKINEIRKVYKNDNIDLLFIQHYPFKVKNRIIFTSINDTIHLYTLDNTPKGDTPFWKGDIENTTKILKKYRLK